VSENGKDGSILREVVKRYVAVASDPVQEERRRLWRDHNSLIRTRPLVYVRGGRAWDEIPEIARLHCEDRFFRMVERRLRGELFRASLGDDSIFEPWLTVRAAHKCTGWGIGPTRTHTEFAKGSWKADYPIKDEADIEKLRPPRHEIDEQATARAAARLRNAVGDLIAIDVDRAPAYRVWSADLSTDLHYLRGIENFMLDMIDRPAWLKRLVAFMRDGVLRTHEQAEAAGDWSLANHENQAMPYARELDDPAPNVHGVERNRLWGFLAAQEFTLVSPRMHDEFLLQDQLPILKAFGLTAYGCCEDLTRKIDMLRQIPNLRRIAVTPRADVPACAEQIGADYVISWRPNPAQMVCCGYDERLVRKVVTDALDATRGQHVDISLKDVDTVEGDPHRLQRWTRLVKGLCEDYA
jgi:hypothetical protein